MAGTATESPYTASNAHRIKFKQDLPPPGGYQRIFWARTFPKTWVNARRLGLFVVGWSVYTVYSYNNSKRRLMTTVLWENDGKVAMTPFIYAERDRNVLKHTRKVRAAEEEVMKEVPGWKTGTWYGEPVYFTLGDKWRDASFVENAHHISPHRRYLTYTWGNHMEYSLPHIWTKYMPQWFSDRFI